MSKFTFATALVGATFGLSLLTPANALTKADCRPLTADNARECCEAPNWKALITSRDEAICKRPEFSAPLAATPPATATPETPETPPGTEPPEQAAGINNGHGNLNQNAPGNSLNNNNAENSENSGEGNSGSGGGGHQF